MRHGMEAGMDHLVVHGKYEDLLKVALHEMLQLLLAFAVDVPDPALSRGISLRLNRG